MADYGLGSKVDHDYLSGNPPPRYMFIFGEREASPDGAPGDEDPILGFRSSTTTTGSDAKFVAGVLSGTLPTPEHNITVSNISAGIIGESDRVTVTPALIFNPQASAPATVTGNLYFDSGSGELKVYSGGWQTLTTGAGMTAHDLTGAYHTEDATGGAGNVLRASGATSFAWAQLQFSDIGGTLPTHGESVHTGDVLPDADQTTTGIIKSQADSKGFATGASDDLYMYHNGSHSFIQALNTGSLYIQANTGSINNDIRDVFYIRDLDDASANILICDTNNRYFNFGTTTDPMISYFTNHTYVGNAVPSSATAVTDAPIDSVWLALQRRGAQSAYHAVAGEKDHFYMIHKHPDWTITSSGGGSPNTDYLFDNNISSNAEVTVASLPWTLTIEYSGSYIEYTDVLYLEILGHRLSQSSFTITDWTVEVKDTVSTWWTVLDRDTTITDYPNIMVPLWITGMDSVNYKQITGVRITINAGTGSTWDTPDMWFSQISLRNTRPTGTPADGVGALDIQGGLIYGDVERYDAYSSTTLTNITQTTANYPFHVMANTYTSTDYIPLLCYSTDSDNPTKPKIGLFAYNDGTGSELFIGTSNAYATGLIKKIRIDENGAIFADGDGTFYDGSGSYYVTVGNTGTDGTGAIISNTNTGYGMWHIDANGLWALSKSYSWSNAYKIETDYGTTGTTRFSSGGTEFMRADNTGLTEFAGQKFKIDAGGFIAEYGDSATFNDDDVIAWDTGTSKFTVQTPVHTDADAIHDNVAGEINAITSKATPVGADIVVIEDSADSYNKKKATITSLGVGGGGPGTGTQWTLPVWDTTTTLGDSMISQNSGGTEAYVGGYTVLGTTSLGSNGYHNVEVYGVTSGANSPSITFVGSGDVHPIMHIWNHTHDTTYIAFDAYTDAGGWQSADAGSNFRIGKESDVFKISAETGIAQGSTITWLDAVTISAAGEITKLGQDAPSTSDFLQWDGSKVVWTAGVDSLNDLSDVVISAYTSGFVLVADGVGSYDSGYLDHTYLSSKGTNTHAQIDTHISTSNIHYLQSAITTVGTVTSGSWTASVIDSAYLDSSFSATTVDCSSWTRGQYLIVDGAPAVATNSITMGTSDSGTTLRIYGDTGYVMDIAPISSYCTLSTTGSYFRFISNIYTYHIRPITSNTYSIGSSTSNKYNTIFVSTVNTGDIEFGNKFKIKEVNHPDWDGDPDAPYSKMFATTKRDGAGLEFYNSRGRKIALLDYDGNFHVRGKIHECSSIFK